MKTSTAILLSAALLAGCASHPDDIAAEQISSRPYRGLDCEGLEEALIRSSNALAEVSKRQKNKRSTDAVGNVLLLPGLFSLAKDSSEAVARHKGEVQTITLELDKKGCEYAPVVLESEDENEQEEN